MKVDEIIKLLDANRAWLSKLTGEELTGFGLIIPPEGEPVEIRLSGTTLTPSVFWKYLAERCTEQQTSGASNQFIATPMRSR